LGLTNFFPPVGSNLSSGRGSVSLHPFQQKTRLVKFDPQRNCATWESIRNHGQIWTVSSCHQLFIHIISLIEDHYSDLQMDTNGVSNANHGYQRIHGRNPQQDWKESTSPHEICHSPSVRPNYSPSMTQDYNKLNMVG
jgi:hypothetical protein